jgi:hypothetical protein
LLPAVDWPIGSGLVLVAAVNHAAALQHARMVAKILQFQNSIFNFRIFRNTEVGFVGDEDGPRLGGRGDMKGAGVT